MNRPNKEDYYLDIADYSKTYIGKYAIDLEKYCNELEKALDKACARIAELEKYKWHDLRKNPDDLPPINPRNTHENDVYLYVKYETSKGIEKRYLIGHLRDKKPYIIKNEKGDDNILGVPTYETNWLVWDLPVFFESKVIAWKYIEEFIDE